MFPGQCLLQQAEMTLNLSMEVEIHSSLPGMVLFCVDRLYRLVNPFLLVFLPFGISQTGSSKNKNDKAAVNAFLSANAEDVKIFYRWRM